MAVTHRNPAYSLLKVLASAVHLLVQLGRNNAYGPSLAYPLLESVPAWGIDASSCLQQILEERGA